MTVDDTATIDDLLRHVEEPEASAPRRKTGVGWALRVVLLAGAWTALTVFGLRLLGLNLSAIGAFAGFLALLLVRRMTVRLAPPVPPRRTRGRPTRWADGPDRSTGDDALRSAVRAWAQGLAWSHGNPGSFARVVLPRLRDLADERLRLRHGVTRASDPDRARQLLGERTWAILDGHPNRTPTLTDYTAIASELEKI